MELLIVLVIAAAVAYVWYKYHQRHQMHTYLNNIVAELAYYKPDNTNKPLPFEQLEENEKLLISSTGVLDRPGSIYVTTHRIVCHHSDDGNVTSIPQTSVEHTEIISDGRTVRMRLVHGTHVTVTFNHRLSPRDMATILMVMHKQNFYARNNN